MKGSPEILRSAYRSSNESTEQRRGAKNMDKPSKDIDGKDWLEAELADTLDEDYELELSEPALAMEIRRIYNRTHPPTIDRHDYFRDLLVLQSELIKLQSWVAYTKG